MSKILGKNVSLYVVTNGSPEIREIIGCARNCMLKTSANIAGKSTIGSGIWQEFIGLSMSWSASVDGLCTVDENMGLPELRELQFSLNPINIYFEVSSPTGIYVYYGTCIIQDVQETGNYADVENYSVQLQGTGTLVQLYYGNFPPLFQIREVQPNVPIAGKTTLSFVWNAASPVPQSYTVKIIDTTTNTISYVTNIPEAGHTVNIVVDSSHNYAFQIKSIYAQGESGYSPLISWP